MLLLLDNKLYAAPIENPQVNLSSVLLVKPIANAATDHLGPGNRNWHLGRVSSMISVESVSPLLTVYPLVTWPTSSRLPR